MERRCSNCALKALKNGMCPIFNANMEEEMGCPYYTTKIETCDLCGNLIPKHGVLEEIDGEWHMLCQTCAHSIPCKLCKHLTECKFYQDQSCPEPPMVIREIRQGNMIAQTQVINPKRIHLTCAAGCKCYRPEGLKDGTYCMKQMECGCNNFYNIWRK